MCGCGPICPEAIVNKAVYVATQLHKEHPLTSGLLVFHFMPGAYHLQSAAPQRAATATHSSDALCTPGLAHAPASSSHR